MMNQPPVRPEGLYLLFVCYVPCTRSIEVAKIVKNVGWNSLYDSLALYRHNAFPTF